MNDEITSPVRKEEKKVSKPPVRAAPEKKAESSTAVKTTAKPSGP